MVSFVKSHQGGHDGVDILRGGQHVPRDLVRDLVQLPDLVLVGVEDGGGRVGLRPGLEQQAQVPLVELHLFLQRLLVIEPVNNSHHV